MTVSQFITHKILDVILIFGGLSLVHQSCGWDWWSGFGALLIFFAGVSVTFNQEATP